MSGIQNAGQMQIDADRIRWILLAREKVKRKEESHHRASAYNLCKSCLPWCQIDDVHQTIQKLKMTHIHTNTHRNMHTNIPQFEYKKGITHRNPSTNKKKKN